MRTLLPVVSLLVPAFLAAQDPEAKKPEATNRSDVQAKATNPIVTIETSMGTIVAELYPEAAPETVANFVGLAEGTKEWTTKSGEKVKRPFYDGLVFHRVIKDFMIQGGCPEGTGSGGPGYRFADEFNYEKLGLTEVMAVDKDGQPSPLAGPDIRAAVRAAAQKLGIKSQEEFEKRMEEVTAVLQKQSVADMLVASGRKDNRALKAAYRPLRGVLAMANSGPDTNGSQFFVNLVDTPWLTGRHTVFGRVIKGMDVVDEIGNVEVSERVSRPKEDVIIKTIRLTEAEPGKGK